MNIKDNISTNGRDAIVWHSTRSSALMEIILSGNFSAGGAGGAMLGKGFYANLRLHQAQKNNYGPLIMKARIVALKNLFIWPWEQFVAVYGEGVATQDNYLNWQATKFSISTSGYDGRTFQVGSKYAGTDTHYGPHKLVMKSSAKGMIYVGGYDGLSAVIWDPNKYVTPLAYSKDNGETWIEVDRAKIKEQLSQDQRSLSATWQHENIRSDKRAEDLRKRYENLPEAQQQKAVVSHLARIKEPGKKHQRWLALKEVFPNLDWNAEPLAITDSEFELNKIDKNKSEVVRDGEVVYTLEKKGSKWTCTCPGFKYRGKCKHTQQIDPGSVRKPRADVEAFIPEIENIFKEFEHWEVVGSYRRGAKDAKDVDILVECGTSEFKTILEAFQEDPGYKHTMAGPDIIRGVYKGFPMDVNRVIPGEWAPQLLYRTGPKELNLRMRGLAKSKGWALNEHGLFERDSNNKVDYTNKVIEGKSEEEFFEALGMPFLKPEQRIK